MKIRELLWISGLGSALGPIGCAGAEASEATQTRVELAAAVEALAMPLVLPADPVVDPPVGGPTVNVWPPHGARFIRGARFDICVEGTGTGPNYGFSASIKIDGVAQPFSSGTTDANVTDGISSAGWGGFNLRGYSNQRAGVHEIDTTFTSSLGTKRVKSYFVIERLDYVPNRHRVKNVILLLGDGMGIGVRTAARVARYGEQKGIRATD